MLSDSMAVVLCERGRVASIFQFCDQSIVLIQINFFTQIKFATINNSLIKNLTLSIYNRKMCLSVFVFT